MKYIYFLISIAVFFSCSTKNNESSDLGKSSHQFTEFPMASNIRAIEVLDENTMWFGGNKGVFGYTKDGGANWKTDSIVKNGNPLEFRSIAITGEAVFLFSVGSPAYLLKSNDEGKTWLTVYEENHPDAFYDCMKFWDDAHGIAIGDPTDGCLSIIITEDGGNTWHKLDCSDLPPTAEGEAAFAASNTNISLASDHVWIASGGKKARVFHSPDRGKSWEVFNTPIQQGGKMTGIFSMDFYDENNGIIWGGDWENQEDNVGNKAITTDGGKTWQLLTNGQGPGYRSCVQYIPNTQCIGIIAVGIPGISISKDGGQSWENIEQTYFYTIRFAPTGKVAWLAGKNKIARMMFGG